MKHFILGLLLCLLVSPALADAPRAVVFDFELIDTSLTGEMKGANKDETARLAKMAPILRSKLTAADRYEVVDLGPQEAVAKASNLQACGGCDVEIAKKLGADVSITGTVQKASETLFTINIYVRDVKTGKVINAMSADVRNNTDEGWARGLDYLIRNRLLAASGKAPQ